MQRTQRKVQNTARKRNGRCSNLMQGMQEVANGFAGICHMIQDNVGGVQSVQSVVETSY